MKRSSAFTLIELLVVISIIGILASLAIPAVLSGIGKAQMTGALSNMKQVHLICQQMSLDGTTTGDTNLAWPGSVGSYAAWVANATPSYVSLNDFSKIMSVAGAITTNATNGNTNGVVVLKVLDSDDGSAALLMSRNVTNSGATAWTLQTNAASSLFGNRGFVIFRKGGDGGVYLPKQVTNIALTGTPTNAL